MIDEFFKELSAQAQIESIALGGSRSCETNDDRSDYDVYVYVTSPVSEEVRNNILGRYCRYTEIGNSYWEYEDNCVLNNGIDIDIIYRDLNDFCKTIEAVVEGCRAGNGYTTCMWHNLLNCRIICDKCGRLAQAKKRFSVPYPAKLKNNIIERNMNLLSDAMPAYSHQIDKACERNDRVSIVHRTSAFLESYFDIIFAVNELTHPGEKRLIKLCMQRCKVLPNNFEDNLNRLFNDMFANTGALKNDLEDILSELKKII